jgi:cyclopropane fatty-acyl-phospholipid synthase-like methyltransferase
MASPAPHTGSHVQRTPDDLYITPPPWDIGRPQAAFLALANAGAIRGRVLDAGCGTGEHTLMCAGLGLDATGVDLAAKALATAEEKARQRGHTARFLRQDARRLADLGETFDTALDCGLFHGIPMDDRALYVDSLRSVIQPGGRYFMLGFSDKQSNDGWPRVHRLTRNEITTAFTDGWRVGSIEPSTIEITTEGLLAESRTSLAPDGIRAWLVALTRI